MTARRPTAPRPSAARPPTPRPPAARPPAPRESAARPPAPRESGTRAGTTRDATGRGPALAAGGRPRPPMIRPLTAIAGVMVILTLLVAPYVHPWLDQQSEIAAGQARVTQLQRDVDQLTVQRRRWNDPAYVKTQARQRLRYVMPGDVGLVEFDDLPRPSPTPDPRQASSAVPTRDSARPWYDTFWQSVRLAGNSPS